MKTQPIALPLIFFILILFFTNCNKVENSPDTEEHYGWHESMTGKILFGEVDLFVINADGTTQINLDEDISFSKDARWSPDGSKIVFVSYDQGIVIINRDGSGETIIVDDNNCLSSVWSPDGSMIAYILNDTICVLNLENSNLTVFEQPLSKLEYLDWSPTGTKITFTDNPIGDLHYIKILDLIDGTTEEILQNTRKMFYPSWSPDGNKIAFGSFEMDTYQVFTINADGTNKKLIWDSANKPKTNESFLPWSPDGHMIALGTYNGVYIIDLNGTTITVIEMFGFCYNLDWH